MTDVCTCTVSYSLTMTSHVLDAEDSCHDHGVKKWCRTCGRVVRGYHTVHDSFQERVQNVYATKHPLHPNDPYRK